MPSTSFNSYFALIDCNNFFASCEQVFSPQLLGKPLVILSNNDGCVIARSPEAKALGIKMGEPAFKNRELFASKKVKVLSSNFALYGEMSERVMAILETWGYPVEIYSIDEAFLHLPSLSHEEMEELGSAIRNKIYQWVGIRVAVGIAPTKTLAKAANQIAKKNKGVSVLSNQEAISQVLSHYPVEEVWGIGRRLSIALRSYGIQTVNELVQCDDFFLQKTFSVSMVRMAWELRGKSCLNEGFSSERSQSITCSRSFGKKVVELSELKEAVATYMAKAALRLRSQNGCAGRIHVFVCQDHLHSQSATCELPTATSYTPELIHYAHEILSRLFKQGLSYKKAGVILSDIVSKSEIQPDLLNPVNLKKREATMKTMDAINTRFERKILRFAAEGFTQSWRMRSANKSPGFTTHWEELPIVYLSY